MRAIHLTHAAPADALEYLVGSEFCARQHGGPILRAGHRTCQIQGAQPTAREGRTSGRFGGGCEGLDMPTGHLTVKAMPR